MPVISIAMLVGLMAMAALPPLNGFAGEWVIYQSFFKLSNSGAFVARLLGPLLAVGLAITGALAVMCMAKVYGVTFLGAPRTKEAENATCAPLLMSVSVVALAICCVIGGVAAPWLLPMLSAAVPLPLEPANTTVSQPMITLLLIACPLLPFIIMAICKGDRLPSRSRGAARSVRLRPRKINGDYRSRFCHAGETGVCAGAETTQMAESGVSGAGLAVRGECVAVPPDGAG